MKSSTILKEAARLLSSPDSWCQGDLARNHLGAPADVDSDSAVKFCALGAIRRASRGNDYINTAYLWAEALLPPPVVDLLSVWNDDYRRSHAEVVALLTEAAEIAEICED